MWCSGRILSQKKWVHGIIFPTGPYIISLHQFSCIEVFVCANLGPHVMWCTEDVFGCRQLTPQVRVCWASLSIDICWLIIYIDFAIEALHHTCGSIGSCRLLVTSNFIVWNDIFVPESAVFYNVDTADYFYKLKMFMYNKPVELTFEPMHLYLL